jgi:hypothetical protein
MAERSDENQSDVSYCWKVLNVGCNFTSDLASIGGLHKKLWASKVAGIRILKILGLPIWESWDKMIFGCMPNDTKNTIRERW